MSDDPELQALNSVNSALQGLDRDAQQRVLDYVAKKLGLTAATYNSSDRAHDKYDDFAIRSEGNNAAPQIDESFDEDLDGISPIAKKWMRRNGLTIDQLGKFFSLGVDEIDVVAKGVPGTGKKARARNVILLKGLATYLSTGVPRVTAEQIKEACLHYDAYDSPNHATNIKAMASELSGSKSSGFALTARGLTVATELIKEMLGNNN